MKKRKYLSIIVILTLLALSFAVIFAGGDGDKTKEEAVIRVWKGPHTPDDPAVFADVIAAFEADNPGATVEYTPTPWDTIIEKYTTAFASGNPPDIIYAFTGGYVDGVVGQCYDIRDIFDDEELGYLKKGVADSLLGETTVDGKLIAIPYFTAGAAFVYNIDLLNDAGFDRPPDTIDDLISYARALTKDFDGDGKIDQYGYGQLSYDTAEAKPEFFLFAYGYNLFNEDMSSVGYNDSDAFNAFKLIDRLWNADGTAVPIGLYPGTTMTDAFFDNKFAMWVTHNQIVAHLADYPDFNIGVAKMPKGPGTNLADGRGTYAGSGFWCIAESTKHLELAKDFVLKLYDPMYQKEIAKAFGFVPSNTDIKMEMDPISKAFADVSLNYGVPYRFGPHVNEVKEAVWRAMQALQSGAVGPMEAWEQAVSEGEAALQ
jgi:ABC-type glycerol-3-phosphate transport system substrate-binding protein